ncbi:uncharacterized protein LOC129944859 [Eupeodes corollae]|uniref:uncharacterized protein LOC129944859 n=1 Tax=Eupeodes corollae TaxID=290404 RepID=UPI00249031DC|nr:uncharacterized protein LOC129944859 [Eupeodes corollae]
MNSIFLLTLSALCSSGLAYQVNEKQESFVPKLPLRPGDLLRSLDALISDAQVIYSPLQETPPLKLAQRRVYDDDESNHDNQESESEYDYDKAYENFVNKYFAKGEEDLDSEDTHDGNENDDDGYEEKAEGIEDVAPYGHSDEIDNDQKDKEKSSSSGSKKCEMIKIGNQNCKVCEDPRSNEKSKTCSYSSDDKPQSYGYSKQRSTKHSSDDDDDDEDEDDVDDDARGPKTGKSLKRETSLSNKSKFKPRRTSIEHILKPSSHLDDLTKCTRKFEDGMICFYCSSTSENTRECIVDKSNLKKRRLDEASKKDTATKKIFKRMVTYSFKNDAAPKFNGNTYSAFQGY